MRCPAETQRETWELWGNRQQLHHDEFTLGEAAALIALLNSAAAYQTLEHLYETADLISDECGDRLRADIHGVSVKLFTAVANLPDAGPGFKRLAGAAVAVHDQTIAELQGRDT